MVHVNKQCSLFVQCEAHLKHGLIVSNIVATYHQELAQFMLIMC
jgi:hypothetical protein